MSLESEIEAAIASATGTYHLSSVATSRPILVSRNRVTIDGDGSTLTRTNGYDGLVIASQDWLPPTEGHFPVEPLTSRNAYRTGGTTGIVCWGTGLNRPRLNAVQSGYQHVRRLQVSLWLRKHTSSWRDFAGLAFFGMKGPDNNHPGPFVVEWHPDFGMRLLFQDSTGTTHIGPIIQYPVGVEPDVIQVHLHVDLDAGVATAVLNDVVVSTAPIPLGLSFESGRAACGFMASGIHDNGHVWTGPDLSYLGAIVSVNEPLWVPPSGGHWFNGLPSWVWSYQGSAAEGQFVLWWGSEGWGHGLLVRANPGDVRTVGVRVRDLAVTGWCRYGAGVSAWPSNELRLRDLYTSGGAFGLTQPNGPTNSYTTQIADCGSDHAGHAGFWFDHAAVLVQGLTSIRYTGEHAIRGRSTNLSIDHLDYAPGGEPEPLQSLVQLDWTAVANLRNCSANYEGQQEPPANGYYLFTPTQDGGAGNTVVSLDVCQAQGAAGAVPAIVFSEFPQSGRTAYYEVRSPIEGDIVCGPGWTGF